jgi:hypothetical protein
VKAASSDEKEDDVNSHEKEDDDEDKVHPLSCGTWNHLLLARPKEEEEAEMKVKVEQPKEDIEPQAEADGGKEAGAEETEAEAEAEAEEQLDVIEESEDTLLLLPWQELIPASATATWTSKPTFQLGDERTTSCVAL